MTGSSTLSFNLKLNNFYFNEIFTKIIPMWLHDYQARQTIQTLSGENFLDSLKM